MKLTIKRNQKDVKGMFGGHKGVSFTLYARADVTDEERSLIDHYQVGQHVLVVFEIPVRGDQSVTFRWTVQHLIDGETTEADSISTLISLEEQIKESCRNLKELLGVMKTFGGEETFEI